MTRLAQPIHLSTEDTLEIQQAKELANEAGRLLKMVTDEVSKYVVGAENTTLHLLIALLAGGHVLLEGVPGVAKTTLSKVFAKLLGCHHQRVQFTPDLLPSDITGTSIFDWNTSDFVLRKGPVFCQVLLADEINRAPAKTQSALLEAMQEHQVTIDGHTLPLPSPFIVLATHNPIEYEGVYRLPEAQLDRFMLRIEVSYPGYDNEVALLKLNGQIRADVTSYFTPESICSLQKRLPHVYGHESLYHYIVQLCEATRRHPSVRLGASPRAAIMILQCARAHAALLGRYYFSHEDIQAVVPRVLHHRIILLQDAEFEGITPAHVIHDILEQVRVHDTGH